MLAPVTYMTAHLQALLTMSVHQGITCIHGCVGIWQTEPPSPPGTHAGVSQPGHAQQRILDNQGQHPQCCVTFTAHITKRCFLLCC